MIQPSWSFFVLSLGVTVAIQQPLSSTIPVSPRFQIEGYTFHSWMVRLIARADEKSVCSGTLIHPRLVLTACHCVSQLENRRLKALNQRLYSVVTSALGYRRQSRSIARFVLHLQCQSSNFAFKYDHAIIDLVDSFEIDNSISPIFVPSRNPGEVSTFIRQKIQSREDCEVIGWSGNRTCSLKGLLFGPQDCSVLWRNYSDEDWSKRAFEVCVTIDDTRQGCLADSGSPLVCRGVLVAFLSWKPFDDSETALYSTIEPSMQLLSLVYRFHMYSNSSLNRPAFLFVIITFFFY